jgi:hypothetical protein
LGVIHPIIQEIFRKGLGKRPYFLRVNVGLVCGMWGKGIEEVGEDERMH